MEAINEILSIIPVPVAVILMLGGLVFYVIGGIRLGYGAAVKNLVLNLITQAEHEIQGTKRGAERKAWVVKMLRARGRGIFRPGKGGEEGNEEFEDSVQHFKTPFCF